MVIIVYVQYTLAVNSMSIKPTSKHKMIDLYLSWN